MNSVPRIAVALAIVLSGISLVPFVHLPAEGLTWQRYAGLYPYAGAGSRIFLPLGNRLYSGAW